MSRDFLTPASPESYSRYLPRGTTPRPSVHRGQIGIVPRAPHPRSAAVEPEPTHAELDALFGSHIAAVLAAVAGHDGFDIIGTLGLINVAVNLERNDEYDGYGLVAAAELGSAICASRTGSAIAQTPADEPPAHPGSPGEAVWSIQGRLIACVLLSSPPDEPQSFADTAYSRFFGQKQMIRNERFDHQERELLQALMAPPQIAARCRASVGFDVSEALAISDAIFERHDAVYNAALDTGEDPTPGIGHALTLTCTELAAETRLDERAVSAFVDRFSTALGALDQPTRTTGELVVRRRPLIRDGDRVICTVPTNLLRAIRTVLEDGLKATGGWESYQAHRARYCESRAMQILSDFLRPDLALAGLELEGDAGRGECDALLVVGDTALIVEVKSGALRADRLGARAESVHWSIKDLIQRPAAQLDRSRSVLLQGGAARDSTGPLELSFGHVTRVFGVIVTLDPLAFAAPMLWQMQDEGLLSGGACLPWLIGLHELESICQILEFPAQLLHFLDAHQCMDQLRLVEAVDEIDVLMAYLDMGLRFDWLPAAERILLPPDSDQLNNWVFYKRGIRTSVTPRPKQYFPMGVRLRTRAALRRLDGDRPPGFVTASFAAIESALDEADAERVVQPVPAWPAPNAVAVDQGSRRPSRRHRS